MGKGYRNWSLGDLFYSEKKYEEEMAKYEVLGSIANKSNTTSSLVYIIPIVILIIGGIIVAVALKKKKE